MATWGWLTATLLFGLVAGFVGCRVLEYFKNKGK